MPSARALIEVAKAVKTDDFLKAVGIRAAAGFSGGAVTAALSPLTQGVTVGMTGMRAFAGDLAIGASIGAASGAASGNLTDRLAQESLKYAHGLAVWFSVERLGLTAETLPAFALPEQDTMDRLCAGRGTATRRCTDLRPLTLPIFSEGDRSHA